MLHFVAEYGLFFAKAITIVIAILAVFIFMAAAGKNKQKEQLKVTKINNKYKELKQTLNSVITNKKQHKTQKKQAKREAKANKKRQTEPTTKRIFVINFKGDIKASALDSLRNEVTAILQVATNNDEVVITIESPGGMVTNYGLAASQLQRFRDRNIPLTAIIDKVAASGGYMMAAVANKIYAAPFALIGSIGVIAQLPNFHRLLKKHNIDFEQITSGEYKRTLSLFGENTAKGRKKMQEETEEAHSLFKNFVQFNRPNLDIEKIATGEAWYGSRAMELGLIDDIHTSDDYLLKASQTTPIYCVCYEIKKKWNQKLAHSAKVGLRGLFS